jgi:hypothetical protein
VRLVSLPPSDQIECAHVPLHGCRPILSSCQRIDGMNTGKLNEPRVIETHVEFLTQQLHARKQSRLKTSHGLLPQQLMRLCVKGIDIAGIACYLEHMLARQ